jgi:enamine deaminase RidA (YjgF/YER057c/UK114 family)
VPQHCDNNRKDLTMPEITRLEVGPRMSEAVVHNGTIYLAGQIGDPAGDITRQTEEALAEIDRLLAQQGVDKTRILQATIWLASMEDFDAMNAVWDAWVPAGHTPARATGESRLATPGHKVEIIVVAAQK